MSKVLCKIEKVLPEFFYVYGPIATCGFLDGCFRGMEGDIYRFSSIESDGWQVLIKKGFKHNDFISLL